MANFSTAKLMMSEESNISWCIPRHFSDGGAGMVLVHVTYVSILCIYWVDSLFPFFWYWMIS